MKNSEQIEQILDFWFSDHDFNDWFNGGKSFDKKVEKALSQNYEAALSGDYRTWMQDANGCLALCILWDQFPRNVFRGTPRAFATDALARMVTNNAIANGLNERLPKDQQMFLYMPLMHSENSADQARSIYYFNQSSPAIQHNSVIQRFSRYPGRNEALGRLSTKEEKEFLASKEVSF